MSAVVGAQLASLSFSEKHTGCCQTSWFGRDCSCLDYIFCGGEATGLSIIGIGGAAYALQAAVWAAGVLGGGGCCLLTMAGLGHWTWRDAKSLRAINEVNTDLRETGESIGITEHKTEAVAQALLQSNQQLQLEIDQLKGVSANLSQNASHLEGERSKFAAEILVYQQAQGDLETSNKTLKAQVQDFQDALKKINDYLKTFKQQNSALKEMLVTQKESVDSLGEEGEKITGDIAGLESHLDGTVATLSRNIQDVHTTFDAIVSLQMRQKGDLEVQIVHLGKATDALRELDESLDKKQQQLGALSEEEAAVVERMGKLQGQCAALQQSLEQLSVDRDQLNSLESKFHVNAESLDVTEQRFSAATDRLVKAQEEAAALLLDLTIVSTAISDNIKSEEGSL